jgi:hypothetical protein
MMNSHLAKTAHTVARDMVTRRLGQAEPGHASSDEFPETTFDTRQQTGTAPLLTLTDTEIFEITGYRRATEQLAWFKAFGVPAKRRADGTVSVAREHYLRHGAKGATQTATAEPRPKLQSDRKAA